MLFKKTQLKPEKAEKEGKKKNRPSTKKKNTYKYGRY